jgi:hypothetical protein
MADLTTWLPIVLGAIIVIAVCYKVFTDPAVNNYIGYAFVVAVLLCALPTLQTFSYKGQLGEISGQMKNAVAGQGADLGSDISALSKKVDAIITKLNAGGEVQKEISPEYKENKKYDVRVYYAKGVGELAGEVRDFLLSSGYKSSMAYTDFAELASSPPPPGSAQLVFTSASSGLVTTLRNKLKQKFPQLKKIDDRIIDNLNSGDIQVHLF